MSPKTVLQTAGFFFLFLLLPCLLNAQAVRGVAGDLWADVILGQPDFGNVKFNEATSKSLFNPASAYFDTAHDILYVWDSGNNRLLVVHNAGEAGAGQGADMVLGQADFKHAGCNHDSNWQSWSWQSGINSPPVLPNASCLCGQDYVQQSPAEAYSAANMAADSRGNLYVPDYMNNRVLMFPAPVTTGEPASLVWGQPDFNGREHNNAGNNQPGAPSATSLNFYSNLGFENNNYAAGVAVDGWGNLWVADKDNNRVLEFAAQSGGVPSGTASVVLGQPNFTSNTEAAGLQDYTRLRQPVAVRVGPDGNVYVAEDDPSVPWGRICIYQPAGSSNGVPQYAATGQSAVTAILAGASPVEGLEIDPNLEGPSTIGLWASVEMLPLVTGGGTVYYNAVNEYQVNLAQNFAVRQTKEIFNLQHLVGSPGVDLNGAVYVAQTNNHSVLRFVDANPAGSPQTLTQDVDLFDSNAAVPNVVLPEPNHIGDIGMYNSHSVVLAAAANGESQLILADGNRFHYWNLPSAGPVAFANGQPEDGYFGTNTPYVFNPNSVFGAVAVDPTGHLWVLGGQTSGTPPLGLNAFNLPVGIQASPIGSLPLSQPIPVLNMGFSVTLSITGMTVDANGYLWVSDTVDSRVMRIRDPLTNPRIDIILGQVNPGYGNPVGNSCNGNGSYSYGVQVGNQIGCTSGSMSATFLNQPGDIGMDHHGDLYVSDDWLEAEGNFRMLRWDLKSLPTTQTTCLFAIPADGVYGTGGSFTNGPGYGGSDDEAFWQMAFTSDDSVMVAGTNSQAAIGGSPIVIENPRNGINPAGTPDIPGAGDNPAPGNNRHLSDLGPQSMGVAFDGNDNLYVSESNRSRILEYLQPFATPFTVIPTPTPTLGCCQAAQTLAGQGGAGGNFSGVRYLAVNQAGTTLYAADSGNNRIQEFNLVNGSPAVPAGILTGFNNPFALSFGSDGDLYVGEYGGADVKKVNPADGTILATIPCSGPIMGVLEDANGDVYASSPAIPEVEIFPYNSAAGSYGTAIHLTNNISGPRGMVKDGGSLYLADIGYQAVDKFTEGGGYSFSFTKTMGSFNAPFQVSQDPAGNFYVAVENGNQWSVFTPAFNPLYGCSVTAPNGVAADQAGNVYVGAGNQIQVYSSCRSIVYTDTPTPTETPTFTPNLTPSLTPTISPTPTPAPAFCGAPASWPVTQPYGLAVNNAGTSIFVADEIADQVDVLNGSGGSLGAIGSGTVIQPVGVAVDGNGNIYVTDEVQDYYTNGQAQYRVDVFNSSGGVVALWDTLASSAGDFEVPVGIAANSGGTSIYIADQNTEQVEVYSAQGTALNRWGSPGTSGNGTFVYPVGIALDASGNVYVADDGTGLVQVFTPQGVPLDQWDVTQGTPLITANFIAVYDNCLVYVSDGFGEIGIFTTAGRPVGFLQSWNTGSGTQSFQETDGVAVDKNQGFYAGDYVNDQVMKFESCPADPCSVPEPTPSFTPTATATPSPTPTPPATPTVTPTATPSFTSTRTPTVTATLSPTHSPTAASTPTEACGNPVCYPNPARAGREVTLHLPPCDRTGDIRIRFYTTAFRKVLDKPFPSGVPGGTCTLELKDDWGTPLANGLYYVVVDSFGGRKIEKLLILH